MSDEPGKNLYKLQDPTKQYPQPKFRRQTQAAPGSESKMTPRPDHGETTYRGSGRLPNRKALVTGGDSGIGRAAAIAVAREGADLAINYLPSEEKNAKEVIALIEREGRKAIALPGDLGNEKFCRKLVSEAHKRLGGWISSLALPVSNMPSKKSLTLPRSNSRRPIA
jgi:short subunit dehydrogenase